MTSDTRPKGGRFKRFLKKTAIAVAVFVVAVVAINQYDPPLSEAVLAAQQAALRPASVPAADNGYFYAMGLQAPPGADPALVGRQWFDLSQQIDQAALRGEDVAKQREKLVMPPPTTDPSEKQVSEWCSIDQCLQNAVAHPEAFGAMAKRHSEVLQRLDRLMGMPFDEPGQPFVNADSMTQAALAPAMGKLRIHAASLLASGQDVQALDLLARADAFLLRSFVGSHALFPKVLAASMLHRQQGLLVAYVQLFPERAKAQMPALQRFAMPVTEPLGMADAVASETLWTVNLVLNLNRSTATWSWSRFWTTLLLAPRATANLMATSMQPWLALEQQQPGTPAYQTARQQLQEAGQVGVSVGWFWLYNPIGKVLAQAAEPERLSYAYRRDNIVADRRLLKLQLSIASLPARDKASIDALLTEPAYRHPFDGAAPIWTADGHSITYPTLPGMPAPTLPLTFTAL